MPSPSTAPRLVDPGALLAATHELDGGERVRLRLTRPSDAALVADFLDRLSPETRGRRFLGAEPEVAEAAVRHFTFYDPRERLTIAATTPARGGELIVGLADVAFLEAGLAEIGVVVADDRQRRGLGKLLSEAIASLAVKRGATRLRAQMSFDNTPMLRLLERLGRTVRTVDGDRVTAYVRLRADRRRSAA